MASNGSARLEVRPRWPHNTELVDVKPFAGESNGCMRDIRSASGLGDRGWDRLSACGRVCVAAGLVAEPLRHPFPAPYQLPPLLPCTIAFISISACWKRQIQGL